MTRINCVPPQELHQKHLVAEYRELPRVFALAYAAMQRGEKPTDPRNPKDYVLGPGHVRFFYSRLGYLRRRFEELIAEMMRRDYVPKYLTAPSVELPSEWLTNWEPDAKALSLNRERLALRMPK